jgi:hypothetical protein
MYVHMHVTTLWWAHFPRAVWPLSDQNQRHTNKAIEVMYAQEPGQLGIFRVYDLAPLAGTLNFV